MKKVLYLFLFLIVAMGFQKPIQAKENGTTLVTFYHKSFHGKRTASGEKLDNNKYTAASRSLPFGTLVKLTNPKNGASVTVKINDRGRLPKGVLFDLSRAAFKELGSKSNGYLRVRYKILHQKAIKKTALNISDN